MIVSKYFKESEFKRCVPPCSLQDMKQEFMEKLDKVRECAGIPLVMNSAYRSPYYELGKGRSGKGDHPQGCGVDIKALSSQTRYKILRACFECGIKRIGIGKNYIHIGDGKDLPTEVVWHYYE